MRQSHYSLIDEMRSEIIQILAEMQFS